MSTDGRLPAKDKVIIGMLLFFLAVAVSLEAWWLLNASQLVALTPSSALARVFGIYGACDRSYYDRVNGLSLTLEGLNVCVTQFLNVWLIYAIVKRKHYRHALQLTVSAYLSYSLVLYYLQAHLGGYADMREKSLYTFLLFYVTNAPWLLCHLYMAFDSIVAINRHFAGARSTELARAADGQQVRRGEAGVARVVVDDEAASA